MVTYFGQRIKDVIEKEKYLPLSHLGNIVHALASIISNTRILIGEAGQHWRNNLLQIRRDTFLYTAWQQ